MKTYNIVILDDDGIVRESLREFINYQENLRVQQAFENVEDFLAFQFTDAPSVLLLDIGLPGMTGLQAIPLIKQKFDKLEIIILSTYEEEDKILKALCLGAASYISKRASLKQIIDGIQVVLDGGSYMSPRIAREIVNHFFNSKKESTPILKGRQKEIMDLMTLGQTYKEIGLELNISTETVKSHIKKIYRILEVNNKGKAIQLYLNSQK